MTPLLAFLRSRHGMTPNGRGPEACDPGEPPRPIPSTHGRVETIKRVVDYVRRVSRASERASLKAHLARGGVDLDLVEEPDDYHVDWSRVDEGAIDRIQEALYRDGGSHGFALVGAGADRAVFSMGDEVVKVSYFDGDRQTGREVAAWRNSPRADALRLCPVLAAGNGWLVMPRADPYEGGVVGGARLRDLMRFTADVTESNAGIWCGRLVLVDYGV